MKFSLIKSFEKVIRGVIAGAIAVSSGFLAKNLNVDITPDQQLTVVAIAFGVIAGLSNALKHKFPKAFGWL